MAGGAARLRRPACRAKRAERASARGLCTEGERSSFLHFIPLGGHTSPLRGEAERETPQLQLLQQAQVLAPQLREDLVCPEQRSAGSLPPRRQRRRRGTAREQEKSGGVRAKRNLVRLLRREERTLRNVCDVYLRFLLKDAESPFLATPVEGQKKDRTLSEGQPAWFFPCRLQG